jgi:hypothetical protein
VKVSLQTGQKGRNRFTFGIAIVPSSYHRGFPFSTRRGA